MREGRRWVCCKQLDRVGSPLRAASSASSSPIRGVYYSGSFMNATINVAIYYFIFNFMFVYKISSPSAFLFKMPVSPPGVYKEFYNTLCKK